MMENSKRGRNVEWELSTGQTEGSTPECGKIIKDMGMGNPETKLESRAREFGATESL